jgi:thiol-disulfide isomerase/thioredoxin
MVEKKPQRAWVVALVLVLVASACGGHQHGTVSSMSVASKHDYEACEHEVPKEVCVQCQPERAAAFKARGDWCKEHDRPESQCLLCHPDLDFSPPKEPPSEADVERIGQNGADIEKLEAHLVSGKVTIFDFYSAWCPPCRKVDEHLYPTLAKRTDIALRKFDVGAWDTPVAERYLSDVAELPYLVFYDGAGKRLGAIAGAKLDEIDRLLETTQTP